MLLQPWRNGSVNSGGGHAADDAVDFDGGSGGAQQRGLAQLRWGRRAIGWKQNSSERPVAVQMRLKEIRWYLEEVMGKRGRPIALPKALVKISGVGPVRHAAGVGVRKESLTPTEDRSQRGGEATPAESTRSGERETVLYCRGVDVLTTRRDVCRARCKTECVFAIRFGCG